MHKFSTLLLTLFLAGCTIPIVHRPTPMPTDLATAQRHVEHTLLRARVPKTTAVEINTDAVIFGIPGTGHYVLPPILYPGIAGAIAYKRARTESRGVAHQIFFEAIGEVEVYENAYVFVKNTGGHLITQVLFASLDDATLFANALLALKQSALQHPARQPEHEAQPASTSLSAGEVLVRWGNPSFIYGTYQDPIYVYVAQNTATVFVFTDRACIYTDVMAAKEVDAFLAMLRARDQKPSTRPQLVH